MSRSTVSELLAMWERGDGERVARTALALLDGELADAPVGTRDAALLDLRERLFGSHFVGRSSCPACNEQIELTFDMDDVRRGPASAPSFRMTIDALEVDVRLPSTIDLQAIEHLSDIGEARAALFVRCVTNVDVRDLPPHAIAAISKRMSEVDPQGDVSFEVECPSCDARWREPFDVVTFLWSELDAAARRALEDVHRLAMAYGWSERDILALSPARRAAYLGMLA